MSATRPLPTTTLRPDVGAAAVWSAWAGLLVAAGIWFVLDAPGSIASYVVLAIFVVVAAWFIGQLLTPRAVEVRLTEDELQARTFWLRRSVLWDHVHLARVRTVFGDPVLELHVRERVTGQDDPWSTRATAVLLPVGADVQVLHAFLAARLGTGGLTTPDRLDPIDAP